MLKVLTYMLKRYFVLMCLFIIGCSTTQERLIKLKDKNIHTVSLSWNGSLEEAKSIVRKVSKDMKLLERKFGTGDFKDRDNNLILLSNNRLKDRTLSFFFGGFIWAPINLGVFFKYDENTETTLITISEEASTFGFRKREELKGRIESISLGL